MDSSRAPAVKTGQSGDSASAIQQHDAYRIALYYCYVPIPNVEAVADFHSDFTDILGGRIRIAREGLNGVLSGPVSDLEDYENKLRKLLCGIADGQHFELDMKCCGLRSELDVSSQLFPSLTIQETCQVVGLVDMNSVRETTDCRKIGYSAKRRARKKEGRLQLEGPTLYQQAQDIFQRSLEDPNSTPHLSPREWNEKIHETSQLPDSKVLFLDCRNSYESAVGYFASPDATTVLTNTRKYPELPQVLLQEADKSLKEASHIFMYCTGGVRCERASGYLKTLLDDKVDVAPKLFQLHGGIQRYLQSDCNELYHGKNFVFDPRRTDPLCGSHGDIVGHCLVCEQPHDDYDNGHAPAQKNEARCVKCRILVLVCDTCRKEVKCWGDCVDKPSVFCGGLEPKVCLHMPPVRQVQL